MGLLALAAAIERRDWALGIAGVFLIVMAVAGIGCCGPEGCATGKW